MDALKVEMSLDNDTGEVYWTCLHFDGHQTHVMGRGGPFIVHPEVKLSDVMASLGASVDMARRTQKEDAGESSCSVE
jgi:hypothetical protein